MEWGRGGVKEGERAREKESKRMKESKRDRVFRERGEREIERERFFKDRTRGRERYRERAREKARDGEIETIEREKERACSIIGNSGQIRTNCRSIFPL